MPAQGPEGVPELRTLWRISNHADLLGTGGLLAPARWHTAGRPVVYLAESPSAALLEVLVHLEVDEAHRPATYQLLKVEAAPRIAFEAIEDRTLPPGWSSDESVTQALGDAWLRASQTALLRVPSAIVPETWNWLLNPRHADATGVRIVQARRDPFDPRLF
jgi:RES domain-containing protein